MYVEKELLAQVLQSARKHWSVRRAATWAGFASAWGAVHLLLNANDRVDDALFGDWREQPVRSPVFVFSNGRSGSTMLHRILSLDAEHFAQFRLYESLFPGVTIQRALQGAAKSKVVAKVGGVLVDKVNETFFSGWEGIHKLGINENEEDEVLFVMALRSPSISLLNPYQEDYEGLGWIDRDAPERRQRLIDSYREVIQKHLFATAPDKHFLTKNVFLTTRLRTLAEGFPDGKFVGLVRNPVEALPSWLNMFYEKWRTHSPEIKKDSAEIRRLAELSFEHLRYMVELKRSMSPEQVRFMRYEDLTRHLTREMESLYDWFGFDISPTFRAEIARAERAQARYRSSHEYALAEFGMSAEWVRAQIPEVFQEFGYDEVFHASSSESVVS